MECPICMDSLSTRQPRDRRSQSFGEGEGQQEEKEKCSTACGHVFHRKCIVKWVQTKENAGCPACRKRVDMRSLRPIFLEPNETGRTPCKKCPKWKILYNKLQAKFDTLRLDLDIEKRVNDLNRDKLKRLEQERDELKQKLENCERERNLSSASFSMLSTGSSCSYTDVVSSCSKSSISPKTSLKIDMNDAFVSSDNSGSGANSGVQEHHSRDQSPTRVAVSKLRNALVGFVSPPQTRSLSTTKKDDALIPGPSSSKPQISLSPIGEDVVDDAIVIRRRKSLTKTKPPEPTPVDPEPIPAAAAPAPRSQGPPVRRSERLQQPSYGYRQTRHPRPRRH